VRYLREAREVSGRNEAFIRRQGGGHGIDPLAVTEEENSKKAFFTVICTPSVAAWDTAHASITHQCLILFYFSVF